MKILELKQNIFKENEVTAKNVQYMEFCQE